MNGQLFICSNVVVHERKCQTEIHCDYLLLGLKSKILTSDIKSAVLGIMDTLARSASPGKCATSHSCPKLFISLEIYPWKWHVSPWAIVD